MAKKIRNPVVVTAQVSLDEDLTTVVSIDEVSVHYELSCDDCELIKKIGNWQIELTPNNNFIEENNYPDWYGYQKIDGI